MTIMLTPALVGSLNTTSENPYLVALNTEGVVVGSTILDGGQTTIAIWGDDTSTTEVDGALAGESISFQLVDGVDLL